MKRKTKIRERKTYTNFSKKSYLLGASTIKVDLGIIDDFPADQKNAHVQA